MNAALIKCQGKVVGISYRESAQLVTDYQYVKHSQLAKYLCSSCRSITFVNRNWLDRVAANPKSLTPHITLVGEFDIPTTEQFKLEANNESN